MLLAFFSFYFTYLTDFATAAQLSDIGPHLKVFELEKNENPQNILQIYTRVDDQCRFLPDRTGKNKPVFDFYWLMGRGTYKRTHSMIRRSIYRHVLMEPDAKERSYSLKLRAGDFERFDTDLNNPRLQIVLRQEPSKCEAVALLQLGPSDTNKVMRIKAVYTEAKRT